MVIWFSMSNGLEILNKRISELIRNRSKTSKGHTWKSIEMQSFRLSVQIWISAQRFRSTVLKNFSDATKQAILIAKNYYDTLVSAFNPLLSILPDTVHISRIWLTDVEIDNDRSISELLNMNGFISHREMMHWLTTTIRLFLKRGGPTPTLVLVRLNIYW